MLQDVLDLGPARLFGLARLLLSIQVMVGMVGCLAFVYGTIHPGQVACALFGIVAVDLRHGPMLRTYVSLLVFLLALDVVWHEFWAERLLRNYTGVREDSEMWWGVMVANTNKICGFAMEMAGAVTRGTSLLVWAALWYGDHLSGNGTTVGYASIPETSSNRW